MRVFDEGFYKDDEEKAEDVRGYVLCTHCDKCTITHNNQIFTDGLYYCTYIKKWKNGDDLIEFMCKGFNVKRCSTCKKTGICNNVGIGLYCNKYKSIELSNHGRYFMGRKGYMQDNDKAAIKAEECYIRFKKKQYANDQRDRVEKTGEYKQDKERNAVMGAVQISYSNKKDKIYFPIKKST